MKEDFMTRMDAITDLIKRLHEVFKDLLQFVKDQLEGLQK